MRIRRNWRTIRKTRSRRRKTIDRGAEQGAGKENEDEDKETEEEETEDKKRKNMKRRKRRMRRRSRKRKRRRRRIIYYNSKPSVSYKNESVSPNEIQFNPIL